MTRLIKIEVEVNCCHDCPRFKFIDEGWSSHHYECEKLGLTSPSIGRGDDEDAIKEINKWFKELCSEEIINEG